MNTETQKRPSLSRSTMIVIGLVVAAVLVALVVALVTSDGSSNSETSDDGASTVTTPVVASEVSPAENQPVVVEGQVLDPLADSSADLSVGAPAPTLRGYSFDGRPVEVVPGDGRNYMVVFLAHWCPHCNAEVPRLVAWNNSGSVPDGLRVIGVSTAVAADRPNYPPSQWVVDKEWPFEVMADSSEMDAATAYGVDGFPFFVVVGADGKVKVRASGEQEIGVIDQLVKDALAG